MKRGVLLLVFAVVVFIGCGRKTAPDLLQQAQEAQQNAQHAADSLGFNANVSALFDPVVGAYQKVFNEHPESPEAEQALFKVAELQAGVLNNPQKAVDAFRNYEKAFPSGPKVQTAMFMIGYVYNNSLNMLDSAAAAYRRFLDRFPESELASSAQYELNTLGKKPEELLPPEPSPAAAQSTAKAH
jgi:outer membrane protein assembly factor BamD (BamD/ComL family)